MIQFFRDFRVRVAALVLVAAFVGYLLCEFHQPLPAATAPTPPPSSTPPATADAPSESAQESSLLRSGGSPLAPTLQSLTDKPRAKPTDAERSIVAASLRKIHDSLAKAELGTTKVVAEKTYTTGTGKFLEVGPLPPEVTAEAYAELGRALHALGPNSPLAARFRYDALSDIELFADRPKPFRLILVQDQKGDGQDIYILDLLVDDHETLMRDATEQLKFSEGPGPGGAIVRSGYFKKGDGKITDWVTKRYAHFFPEKP